MTETPEVPGRQRSRCEGTGEDGQEEQAPGAPGPIDPDGVVLAAEDGTQEVVEVEVMAGGTAKRAGSGESSSSRAFPPITAVPDVCSQLPRTRQRERSREVA